jgi:uncharacterized protein YjbJ (UPF0337 family)
MTCLFNRSIEPSFPARRFSVVNTQQIQGSWNRIRGQVKEKWGNLSDDDLQVQGGNIDQLVGRIQQKTGESREAIEEFLEKLTSRGASAITQAAETAGQYAQMAGSHVREHYQHLAEQVGEGYEQVERVVRHNPVQTVAASFGVGMVFGVLVGLALRSR